MRVLSLTICLCVLLIITGIVSAQMDLPVSGDLNPDFAQHIGLVTTVSQSGEEGIFITNPNGELVISMLLQDIKAASHQYLGGFLVAYDASGQALFELPHGGYQMQLTTSNGAINFSYLNRHSDVEAVEMLVLEEDVLLQTSNDGLYQVYLLTTGELRVIMGLGADRLHYHLTFTGIPALNIKQEVIRDTGSS